MEIENNGVKPGIKVLLIISIAIALTLVIGSLIVLRDQAKIKTSLSSYQADQLPSHEAVQEFTMLTVKSKVLITSWVYLQTLQEEKTTLRTLHNADYPFLQKRIKTLMLSWDNGLQEDMDLVFVKFDSLLMLQQQGVMANLMTYENYEDPVVKFMAENALESEIIPLANEIIVQLESIEKKLDLTTKMTGAQISSVVINSLNKVLSLIFISIVIAVILVILLIKKYRRGGYDNRSSEHVSSVTSSDVATKKIQLIEWIAKSKNEAIIDKIEALQNTAGKLRE
jgi:hypothetical protein